MANAVPVHQADKDEDAKAPSVNVKAETVKVPAKPKADKKPDTKPAELAEGQTRMPDGSIRTDS